MRSFIRQAAVLAAFQIASAALALAGQAVQIKINSLAFAPTEVTARVGDTVEWVNEDFIDHTATAKNGDFDVTIPAGQSAQLQLTHAGTIEYFCRFHPNMTAKIQITHD